MNERIILFGGSFDPIHNGHINIAKIVKDKLAAQQVIFILAKNPRWKKDLTDVQDRLNMLNIAIEPYPGFSVSTYEIQRPDEINYTIDTIRYFKEKFPDAELYFLIGFDQLDKLHAWKAADEIDKLVTIVAYGRHDVIYNQENVRRYHVMTLEEDYYDISSTEIRDMQKSDMPSAVIKYILDHDLYYLKKVSSRLSKARFAHSKSVAWLAYQIASRNALNTHSALIAGLLHDIGKEVEAKNADIIMRNYYPSYMSLPHFAYHQFIGSYLAEHIYQIKDQDILRAIMFHATGNKDLTSLGMIVYASDKIEPLRQFDSSALIAACLNNYEEGFKEVLSANRDYLLGLKKIVSNPLTDACYACYLK